VEIIGSGVFFSLWITNLHAKKQRAAQQLDAGPTGKHMTAAQQFVTVPTGSGALSSNSELNTSHETQVMKEIKTYK
jgi:hypothetical protein